MGEPGVRGHQQQFMLTDQRSDGEQKARFTNLKGAANVDTRLGLAHASIGKMKEIGD